MRGRKQIFSLFCFSLFVFLYKTFPLLHKAHGRQADMGRSTVGEACLLHIGRSNGEDKLVVWQTARIHFQLFHILLTDDPISGGITFIVFHS